MIGKVKASHQIECTPHRPKIQHMSFGSKQDLFLKETPDKEVQPEMNKDKNFDSKKYIAQSLMDTSYKRLVEELTEQGHTLNHVGLFSMSKQENESKVDLVLNDTGRLEPESYQYSSKEFIEILEQIKSEKIKKNSSQKDEYENLFGRIIKFLLPKTGDK